MTHPSASNRFPKAPVVAAILLAGLFAAIVSFPLLLQRTDQRYPYQGIPLLGPDAGVYYAARVREIYDGFPMMGSPFYSAPKDLPYVQPPLPEMTIALLGKAVGFDAVSAFLLANALLAAAAMLAMAGLLFSMTRRPWISVLSSYTVLTAGALLAAPWDARAFIGGTHFSYEFLRFARLLHPQWTTTVFFLALLCFSMWIRSGRRRFAVLASFFAASLVYAYLYAWSYLFAIAGLLLLVFLYRRERRRVVDLIIFFAVTAILSLPYILHLSALIQHPWYAETAMRSGMVLRHGPMVLGVWVIAFLCLGCASKKLWPATWPLLPVVAVAGLVALNQQLITGHFIVPHHYHWYFIQPMASAFFVSCVLQWIVSRIRVPTLFVLGALVLITLCTSIALIQQNGAYRGVSPLWGRLQNAASVLRYVDEHLHPGDSVYSQDIDIENLIPIVTSADVFFAGNANLGLVPLDRARFTYFFDLWLQGVTPAMAEREFPTSRRWTLSSRLHAIYYREASGDFAKIPDSEVAENVALYETFMGLPLQQKLMTYPLTAVITTPGDADTAAWTSLLACTREVYAAGGYGVRILIPHGLPGSCL